MPAPPSSADGASTVALLSDLQTRFAKEGDSTYYDIAFKIASTKGLDEAPLQLTWDPSLEALVIHRYRILRDGKALDLLGDGSKLSVIQREKNMESAALDGQLTATIQPDDVRVGDVIEMAFTVTRHDPALAGNSAVLTGPSDGTPYGRLRVRFIWPDTKKLQWRVFPGVVKPKLTHSQNGNELLADLTDVTTAIAPNGAPGRYAVVNAIDISEFPDWGAVAATALPLYAQALKLGDKSPVRSEAQRIARTTSDPTRRAEMALQLVQEQVRYLFIGMNDGGYVPAAADLTWSRRFGDCKGKTVLLVALLRELGIDADPVLVNANNGDLVASRLPSMAAFDHAIVRARIGNKTYWMDGTRLGDTKLVRLETPQYHAGLPINSATKALAALVPDPLVRPSETVSLTLDASAGIDAPGKVTGEMRFRGASATDMRIKYAGLSAADLDQQLRELWRKNYDQVSPTSISTATDEATDDFVITMTGTAKMGWFSEAGTRWYEVDRAQLGWKFDTSRDRAINKDAPFAIDYPDYWESRETIKLPADGAGFKLQGGSIDKVVGGIYAFHRKVGIEGALVTMESSTRSLASELPSSKAEQTRSEMAELASNGVYVRVPDSYMATAADIAALQGNKEALAKALVHRGALHFDQQELAESLADENSAIAIDPDNATAHAIRALALAVQGSREADGVADHALSLDNKQSLAWRAKAVIALSQKRYSDADSDFSKQLAVDPKDQYGLAGRAGARLLLGRFADAISDADAALSIDPGMNVRIVRAGALVGLGRMEEGLAEADRAIQAAPKDEHNLQARARLRLLAGKQDLARADFDALIKQRPSPDYYLARAELWSSTDAARRNSDITEALRLDPISSKALAMRASYAISDGDIHAAQADIAALEKSEPDSDFAYQLRIKLLQKQGHGPEAIQLIDAYVAKHPKDASALNERCWTKATLNLQLETALADCEASLKLSPDNPATLDSRAFAKLRLGEIDAAIADYDSALKLAPQLPASLFGRAIARSRKGDGAGARQDLAEARKLSPDIDARFASFGMSLPTDLAGQSPVPDHGRHN